MIASLSLILLCQLAGEVIVRGLGLPMPGPVLGLLLLLLLLLARGYTGANPRSLARGFRLSAGVALALVTVALAITGRIGFAFLTGGGAWYLLFGWRGVALGSVMLALNFRGKL